MTKHEKLDRIIQGIKAAQDSLELDHCDPDAVIKNLEDEVSVLTEMMEQEDCGEPIMKRHSLHGKVLDQHIERLIRLADPRCPTNRERELNRLAANPTITHVWIDENNSDIYEED